MRSISARAGWGRTLALIGGITLIACGERTEPAPAAQAAPAARSVALADSSRVEVRSRALRVFAASSSVVDFVVALAPPSRVAALPEQAFDYSTVPGNAEDWKSVPRFSTYVAEAVIALAPDLVIAAQSQDMNTTERLREFGIEVVVLPEVRNWSEARATLLSVGALLELEPGAEAIVRDLDRRVEELKSAPGARRGLRAMCYSNFGSGWSAGINTTIHEQITLAGMVNAMAGRDGHVQVSFEDLIALDPDLILVSMPLREGESTQGDRGGASERLLRSEASLQGLRAIRAGRIVALPPSLFASGSHSIVRGAEELARAVDELLAREEKATTEPRR